MKLFTEKFQNIDVKQICKEIEDKGFFYSQKAIDENLINNVLIDVNENKFSINKNWVTGVYTRSQYYLTNILGCSKSFYNLITNEKIMNTCENYMGRNFRLKATRYYETQPGHEMHWHTDNKADKEFKEIKGLIFIVYLEDVEDGEFQYIKNSHKFSSEKKVNNFKDEEIEEKYKKEVISFKGFKGDIIIYNTYGIHRAKPIKKNSKYIRKSLFFQVDSNLENSEPILINTSYVKTREEKILTFLGLGYDSVNKIYPNTSIFTLPPNKIINSLFIKYLIKSTLEQFIKLIPKKIKKLIKN